MITRALVFSCCLLSTQPLVALIPAFTDLASKKLNVQLQSPVYSDGVMSTDQGGIISGKDLYIQAKKIRYIKREVAGKLEQKIEAEGDLFFRSKGSAYTGSKLEYDLDTQVAVITNVLTDSGLWYLGGSKCVVKPDGSAVLSNSYMTTSENEKNDWSIHASEVYLSKFGTVKAKNVRFMVLKKPVFWLPTLSKDLNRASSSPLKYHFRYFGKHGPRLGVSYTFQVGDTWENRILFDISTTRGFGGGFETEYTNPNGKESFSAFNYIAHDIKTTDTSKMNRYRAQGKYLNVIWNDKVNFKASYDKLSDSSFPGDFTNRGLDSGRAGATEAEFSRYEPNWIGSLNTKIRINNFQSVKQQLPLFTLSLRPMQLGESKVVLDNRLSVGYLDFLYAHQNHNVHDFHSSRAEFTQRLTRPWPVSIFTFTPHAGYRVIGYGNSPQHESKLLAQGILGIDLHTRFQRNYMDGKHILEPYVDYNYYSEPSVKPPRHYLFDLQDGLYRQNFVRFGARNFITFPTRRGWQAQANVDLYARSFINTPTITRKIPIVYLDATLKPTPKTLYTLHSGWDTERKNISYVNVRADLTFTDNFAIGAEYRHRNPFSWRKVDHSNFMIDSFRSESRLRHSELSDRRDTLLTHFFVRLMPSLAFEVRTRLGWHRKHQPSYNEYEVNVITLIRGAFKVTFNFQRRTYENRYGIYFTLGAEPSRSEPSFRRLGQGNYNMP